MTETNAIERTFEWRKVTTLVCGERNEKVT